MVLVGPDKSPEGRHQRPAAGESVMLIVAKHEKQELLWHSFLKPFKRTVSPSFPI